MEKWKREGLTKPQDTTLPTAGAAGSARASGADMRRDNERDAGIVASVRQQIMSDPAVASAIGDIVTAGLEDVGSSVEQMADYERTPSVIDEGGTSAPVANLFDIRMTPGSGASPTTDMYLPITTAVWAYRDPTDGSKKTADLAGTAPDATTKWATLSIAWGVAIYANRSGTSVSLSTSAGSVAGDNDTIMLVDGDGKQVHRGIIQLPGKCCASPGGAAQTEGDADLTPNDTQDSIQTLGTGTNPRVLEIYGFDSAAYVAAASGDLVLVQRMVTKDGVARRTVVYVGVEPL